MTIKDWATNYPTTQDTGVNASDQQPDLINTADDTRVSQIHTLRKKVHDVALKLGDDSGLPSGSITQKIADLIALGATRYRIYNDLTDSTLVGPASYTEVKNSRFYVNAAKKPAYWWAIFEVKTDGELASPMDVKAVIGTNTIAKEGLTPSAWSTTTGSVLNTNGTGQIIDISIQVAIVSGTAHVRYVDIFALEEWLS